MNSHLDTLCPALREMASPELATEIDLVSECRGTGPRLQRERVAMTAGEMAVRSPIHIHFAPVFVSIPVILWSETDKGQRKTTNLALTIYSVQGGRRVLTK